MEAHFFGPKRDLGEKKPKKNLGENVPFHPERILYPKKYEKPEKHIVKSHIWLYRKKWLWELGLTDLGNPADRRGWAPLVRGSLPPDHQK